MAVVFLLYCEQWYDLCVCMDKKGVSSGPAVLCQAVLHFVRHLGHDIFLVL